MSAEEVRAYLQDEIGFLDGAIREALRLKDDDSRGREIDDWEEDSYLSWVDYFRELKALNLEQQWWIDNGQTQHFINTLRTEESALTAMVDKLNGMLNPDDQNNPVLHPRAVPMVSKLRDLLGIELRATTQMRDELEQVGVDPPQK